MIIWDHYKKHIVSAAQALNIDAEVFTVRMMEDAPEIGEDFFRSAEASDIVLLYRTTHGFWDMIDAELKKLGERKRIISFGSDPMFWSATNVDRKLAVETFRYLQNGGEENIRRMLHAISVHTGHSGGEVLPCEDMPWDGCVHPDDPGTVFRTAGGYLENYPAKKGAPWVGVLSSRTNWISGDIEYERTVIHDLESVGLNVLSVMSAAARDESKGSKGIGQALKEYLTEDGVPIVDIIVKLQPFQIGDLGGNGNAAEFLASLNIPVFQPVQSFTMPLEDWRSSSGIESDLSWTVAMPEFEGVIEPLYMGAKKMTADSEYGSCTLADRSRRLAERVKKRAELSRKDVSERRFVFILNNNPCAGLEANVGSASHLDALESVARIMKRMKELGYTVDPPESGKELIETILRKKAISEFRWTTAGEIERCGGVLHKMSAGEYGRFFNELSEEVRARVNGTWGEPPGVGMVLDGNILITGVRFGNVIVAVQPKRGCYGSRCDGTVCKILHDPACPPTHQYMASYHYFGDIFGADAFVHVGTHGSVEFLPGKGVTLSEDCFPDICIGRTPNLYIYNSDNPAEGTVAKRRSYATIIDHMQTVMSDSSLYDSLAELDVLLEQYPTARGDPARYHAFRHMLEDALEKARITEADVSEEVPTDDLVKKCHEILSIIRNSQTETGMHVFGEIPEGPDRVRMIDSITKFDTGKGTPRDLIAASMGFDLDRTTRDPGSIDPVTGLSFGALIEKAGERTREMISMILAGEDGDSIAEHLNITDTVRLAEVIDAVCDTDRRIASSDEMGSLMNAFAGGYVPPGPSGVITRGRADVLPSGRNFYTMDPYRVPTTSSWRVGDRLADLLIGRYVSETGRCPENIGMYWMSTDIMASDGEMLAEIFSLMGVRPKWLPNGQVRSFEIIPAQDLKHPRIDVTVRASGIIRDNFPNCLDIVDSAVCAVAALDEPPEVNYIRKHLLESVASGISEEKATARVFSGQPGSYTSGVNLAVLASAWKEEKDLADIYVAVNGYAYGNGRKGEAAHEQFVSSLSSVDAVFNKTISDEHDLLGCCCYFSNYGGMVSAVKQASGKSVSAYYGDTREPKNIAVNTLGDEVRRVIRTKLLNPAWIDGMKAHGYTGATNIMKKVGRVYGWEATTQVVDDWIFDDIAKAFVNNDEMKEFFEQNNPYAVEEIARRLLEAESRGLWNADPDVLKELKERYLEIEATLEDLAGDGEYQGGTVNIVTAAEVEGWGDEIGRIIESAGKHMKRRT